MTRLQQQGEEKQVEEKQGEEKQVEEKQGEEKQGEEKQGEEKQGEGGENQNPESIPRIVIGNTVYTNYPIRNMSRQDAESLLVSHPEYIFIRTSQNALAANPDMYYVASYYSNGNRRQPIHTIVSRRGHEECNGEIERIIPFLSAYQRLIVIYHSNDFSQTRVSALNPNAHIWLHRRE